MIGKVYSAAVTGIYAVPVEVQADVAPGIPYFELTGNLAGTTKEAKERVRIAIKNSKFQINPSKITINMIPANIRKEGTSYDLAVAVAVLTAVGVIAAKKVSGALFIGELGLDGGICNVSSILPMTLCARDNGFTICYVPMGNVGEASLVTGIRVIGISSLRECVDYINNGCNCRAHVDNNIDNTDDNNIDFADIRGQASAKRAITIAAAARHNLMLIGPPGAGKSMLASRIPTILPGLTDEERLRITSIYSVAGLLKDGLALIRSRPFRAPHHTISRPAFTGGGIIPSPGEISLSDLGVLFLDEINLFSNDVIDSLRLPMEEHRIRIRRLGGTYEYPADFMLVGAMNPCKCGYYPDRTRCNCNDRDIRRYFDRISGPVTDRIDMCVRVTKSGYDEITGAGGTEISSKDMREAVNYCIDIQKERFKKECFRYNSEIPSQLVNKYCTMSQSAKILMKSAFSQYDMSARTYYKIIKIARTIADTEQSDRIEEGHICEAIGYKLM